LLDRLHDRYIYLDYNNYSSCYGYIGAYIPLETNTDSNDRFGGNALIIF
jgi:hypothetical protein